MESISDNALMLKVKVGNLDHLGLLYERYKRPIFGYFYHINGDRMLAEDLVQAVFIRVLKYKHSFKDEGQFKTWIFQIARNVNADYYRKNKNKVEELTEQHHQVSDQGYLAREKEEQLSIMEQALSLLDEDKRELLVLSKLKNMKYKEIGVLYDCAENTVKIKVFRAMKALRKQFEQLETAK